MNHSFGVEYYFLFETFGFESIIVTVPQQDLFRAKRSPPTAEPDLVLRDGALLQRLQLTGVHGRRL